MTPYTTRNERSSPIHFIPRTAEPRVMGRPVVIYDSGVGGLSVTRHFLRACPQQDVVYVADNAWFPYGNKTEDDLRARVSHIIENLTELLSPRGILVACNTASTVLEQHTHQDDLPIVGVLPPIAEAVQTAEGGKIALLATPGTVSRRVIHELIRQYAQSDQVSVAGSLALVHLAEEKMANGHLAPGSTCNALDPVISPEVRASVRTVILGCTHFPLIQSELQAAFPNASHWIDPAADASRRLQELLPTGRTAERSPFEPRSRHLILTGDHNRLTLETVFTRQGLTPLRLRLPASSARPGGTSGSALHHRGSRPEPCRTQSI